MPSIEQTLTVAVENVKAAQLIRDNANNAAADAQSAYEAAIAAAQAAHADMQTFVSTTVPGIGAPPRRVI